MTHFRLKTLMPNLRSERTMQKDVCLILILLLHIESICWLVVCPSFASCLELDKASLITSHVKHVTSTGAFRAPNLVHWPISFLAGFFYWHAVTQLHWIGTSLCCPCKIKFSLFKSGTEERKKNSNSAHIPVPLFFFLKIIFWPLPSLLCATLRLLSASCI